MADRNTVVKNRPIVEPVYKMADRILADNPILATIYTRDDVAKAIVAALAEQETTLAGGIAKALARPTSAPLTGNVTKAVLDGTAVAKSRPESDVSPAGFAKAIARSRVDRAARPNEPTRQGGGSL
jgi:hypothetical protein